MKPEQLIFLEARGQARAILDATVADVNAAAQQTDTDPSDAQIDAGNYKKGKVWIQGLEISIENAAGSTRSGTDKSGKEWSVTMPAAYGYFTRVGDETAPRG